jgi:ribonucleotide monophosphatase NagD (HAD superfamily)
MNGNHGLDEAKQTLDGTQKNHGKCQFIDNNPPNKHVILLFSEFKRRTHTKYVIVGN